MPGAALRARVPRRAAPPRAPRCRAGAAVALQALAPGLSADQLPSALEFLLSRGLADGSSLIREGMIAAGERCIQCVAF